MQKKITKVSCSDWHLGWGYGYTAIGKLELTSEENVYLYKGINQGRHGQKHGGITAKITAIPSGAGEFTITEEVIRTTGGGTPCLSEITKSINQLIN